MIAAAKPLLYLTLLSILLTIGACERRTPAAGSADATHDQDARLAERGDLRREAGWPPETTGEYPVAAYRNYRETGDLDALRKRGKLRILVDISNTDSLHRAATQQDIEIDLARQLAEHLGLEPVVLYTDNFSQLLPLLREGKGDIVANNLVVTPERQSLVDFSIPTTTTHIILVSRSDGPVVTRDAALKGKTLAVTKGTIYEKLAQEFAQQHPGVIVKVTDRNYVDLAVDVSDGKLDFTMVESQVFDLVSQFRHNLQKNIIFPHSYQLAWAVRQHSPMLLNAINAAVRHIKMTRTTARFSGDLDKIKARGFIRAVTRNHPGSYYMWKGRILGYEYELLKKFAQQLDVRLEVLVAPQHSDLMTYLKDGKADIAAALLSITERRKQADMIFSSPYMEAKVGVAGRKGEQLNSINDLAGRTIYVRKSSSQYDAAMALQKKVPGIKVELIPETLNAQQVLDKVADGDYDLTLADDVSVKLEHAWRANVDYILPLQLQSDQYGWMMRKKNPQLRRAVTQFMQGKKITDLRKTLYHKYFDEPKIKREEITKLTKKGHISPYDHLVKKYAERYQFDWRLVVAQMFQESSFDPQAKSWVGARGLMQVMPDTGKQVGEKNLFDPETSVRAGIKYLDWLHRKFEDKEISPENMVWFTLAAYNAGLGHVYDAQELAEQKSWNPRVWFENVDKAMLLLAEREYYERARYGFARGREPFDYVRKISERYRTYVALLEAFKKHNTVSSLNCTLMPAWVTSQLADCAVDRRAAATAR
ncbi:transporter substrate-binding domain-containing protein [Microbulbifer sp. SAOS-129_SWC]|uniref:transporter substrate-binding domain-containing protein n=1 Tax=Microbulbifer sp. SAOS-129_SWC TaxID=3145235 RepID=UPI003217FDAD